MRLRVVSVVGGGKDPSEKTLKLAEAMGAALAKAGYALVTGGMGGVMEAVSRGFAVARGRAAHPPIVGILPSYDPSTANAFVDVVLPTGLGHARNAVVAAAADAVVCLGGAMGALSEIALARKIGRPVIAFAETGGTAALAVKAIPSVLAVDGVEEAIAKLKTLTGGPV